MHQNKSISILKTFSSGEIRQFEDFVNSPYYNKNSQVSKAFEIIKESYPKFEASQLDRNILFAKIFPEETYNEQKLRYLLTDLTKIIEEFLCVRAIADEELFKLHLLLYTYRIRKLEKPFLNIYKSAQKLLEDWPRRDVSHSFYEYLIEEDMYRFSSDKQEHMQKSNLQKVVDSLDKYFILNKMRYSAEILNNRNVVAINYKLFLYEEIMNHLRNNPLEDVPAAKVYYTVIQTLTEPDNKLHLLSLLQLLKDYRDIFSKDELFDMYVYAKNFCIRRINNGATEYIRELFDLYKIILDNRIIFRDNYMSQWDYKNIVYLGLRLEEYSWVKNFIVKYNEELDPKTRKNAMSYNMAYYHFFLNNYDETLTLLRSVEFSDVYYHLDSKSLLMKTYYELEETEPFFSLIDAFKVYIKRNKQIPHSQKNNYNNLIKLISKLYKWKINPKKDIKKLADEIEHTKPIADIIWLKKKLAQAEERAIKLSESWR